MEQQNQTMYTNKTDSNSINDQNESRNPFDKFRKKTVEVYKNKINNKDDTFMNDYN